VSAPEVRRDFAVFGVAANLGRYADCFDAVVLMVRWMLNVVWQPIFKHFREAGQIHSKSTKKSSVGFLFERCFNSASDWIYSKRDRSACQSKPIWVCELKTNPKFFFKKNFRAVPVGKI
jgi:hypothetical protein